jgi:hypothetical protein
MATVYCVKLSNGTRQARSDGEWCKTLEDACELARGHQKQYKSLQVVIEKWERDDTITIRDGREFRLINADIYGKNI